MEYSEIIHGSSGRTIENYGAKFKTLRKIDFPLTTCVWQCGAHIQDGKGKCKF